MFLSEATSNSIQFFYLVPFVIYFPVIGLLINIIFGGRLSQRLIGLVASSAVVLAFVVSVLLGISLVGNPEGQVLYLAPWISVGDLQLHWGFQVDTLAVTMMLVVSGVGSLIHIYATGYMAYDVEHNADPSRYRRFFVFINLFIAMMMILVSADNYLMLFVGWEGVGLCSYLLIGYWYDKGKDGIGNAIAGKKAFITNRIGDFGFIIAAFLIFVVFGTFEFHGIFEQAHEVPEIAIIAITLFMLLGVTGKSAQIPLYVWLPDAMAGPTPVSALIHAATMVTAGVYLIVRSAALFVEVPLAQNIVAIVGAATALFAATIAVGQFDIKRVLAYSTISQLGFMVAAAGMGAFVAAIFHLITHAFFKALLFLSAGSVIQGLEKGHHHVEHDPALKKQISSEHHDFDPQDMRYMGGLRKTMKITFWVYIIGAVALAGLPPLSGFWSKDEILAEAIYSGIELNSPAYFTVYLFLTLAAILTAFYMGRQIFMVFFGKPRTPFVKYAKESPLVMTIPLIILAFFSIVDGMINLPRIHTFGHWLESSFEIIHEYIHVIEFNSFVASLSTLLALLGIAVAWWLYGRRYQKMQELPASERSDDPLRSILGPVFTALNNKWWVDELYWTLFINPYVSLAHFLADTVDWRFWHDWFHDTVIARSYHRFAWWLSIQFDMNIIDRTANGLADFTKNTAARWRKIQTGYVRNYALSIFLGVVLIVGILILRGI
jgi:NADH-quinone oxidoreductase subunit L